MSGIQHNQIVSIDNSMDEDFEMTEEEEAQFMKMAEEKLQKFDGDKTQMDSESQEDTDKNVSIIIICIHIINIVF